MKTDKNKVTADSEDQEQPKHLGNREGTDEDSAEPQSKKKRGVMGMKLGDTVYYKPSPNDNTVSGNTDKEAAAIVSEVIDDDTVNLTVFRDGPPTNKQGVRREGTKRKSDSSADAGTFRERE